MTPCGKSLRSLPREPRGFALVLTVTLLAFLVLILVALATLTRIETQVAGNHQQLAQARQNALMALNIALGQLQKYAGPDQRVTATADLAADANGNAISSGDAANGTATNGLVGPQNGTRYWTGVWGNSDPSDPVAGNGNIFEKTPAPVLLNWLVSGNEDVTLDDTRFDLETGRVTAGAALPTGSNFRPNDLTDLTSANVAGTYLGKVRGLDAAILVGRNTVGSTPADAAHYVLAPLVDIKSEQVLGASGEQKIGRYAYWVGDEGVKARLNLVDKYSTYGDAAAANAVSLPTPSGTLNTTDGALARARLLTAPRSGLEAIADFAGSGYADRTQSPTSSANTADRVLSLSQTSFLDPAKITAQQIGQRFHDFTTHSVGLEADTLNGGLRRDLTYYLEQPILPTWIGTNGLPAGRGASIIPAAYSPMGGTATSFSGVAVPQWDVLHSFYHPPVTSVSGSDPGTVEVQPATPTQMGITPIVTLFRLELGVRRTAAGEPGVIGTYGDFYGLAAPLVTLANPYTTRLKTANGLSIEVLFSDDYDPNPIAKQAAAYPWVQLHVDQSLANNGGNYNVRVIANRRDGDAIPVPPAGNNGHDSGPALLSNIKFIIPAGTTWMPGEAKVFTLQQDVTVTTYGQPQNVPLREGRADSNSPSFKAVISPPKPVNLTNSRADKMDDYSARTRSVGTIPLKLEIRDANSEQLLQAISGANLITPGGPPSSTSYKFAAGTALNALPLRVREIALVPPGDTVYQDPKLTWVRDAEGQRNGALRLYHDFNPRAAYFRLTNRSFSTAPYTTLSRGPWGNPPDGYHADGFTDYVIPENPQPWGRSVFNDATPEFSVLFDIPRRATVAELPIVSIGQLQHANLTADDLRLNVGHQPGYAVGNAYSSPFVARGKSIDLREDLYYTEYGNWRSGSDPDANGITRSGSIAAGGDASDGPYYIAYTKDGIKQWNKNATPISRPDLFNRHFDLSYLLNASLWDGYFFSTLPQSSVQTAPAARSLPPANPRFSLIDPAAATVSAVLDGEKASAHIAINGAFNVNSTSVDAWVAVLGGMKNLPALPLTNGNSATSQAIFPRSLRQMLTGTASPSGDGADSYSGFRQLTDTQLRTLAASIVQQVRLRGPFLSLAHFVNRALINATEADGVTVRDTLGLGFSGGLQSAIDNSKLNEFSASVMSGDRVRVPPKLSNNSATDPARDIVPVHNDAVGRGTWSLYADGPNFTVGTKTDVPPRRSTGIPGWLTQADVLQAIGPILAARSDTFTIRAYGDVLNPATGEPAARAWCEAVVQRLPDYVDGQDFATASPRAVTSTNKLFGRRFEVVSFRWLGADDI